MLGVLKSLFACHGQALKQGLKNLFNRPISAGITIVVIAMTLTLPAVFWVFSDNMQQLGKDWREKSRISLYLKTDLSLTDQNLLLNRIKVMSGVQNAVLKSAAVGMAELQSQEGMQDIMQYLPENPLPAVIDVAPSMDQNTATALEALAGTFRALPEIEQVRLDLEWINRLHHLLNFVGKLVHGFILLLAFSVSLIISNTLRLAIHTRRDEIQVLKLIGATDRFIMRPFLYLGIFYAFLGGLVALVLATFFVVRLSSFVEQLASVYGMHYTLLGLSGRQILILLVSAGGLGWLSARLSVKKQLDRIDAVV